ncbi:MAG: agmatinase family protein [Chitinophagales bacterium]
MENKTDKQSKIESFDASGVGVANNQFFGLPFNYEESELVLFTVPWEATVSYRAGAAKGAEAMLNASTQIDLYDHDFPGGWKQGIFTSKTASALKKKNTEIRKLAAAHIHALEKGKQGNAEAIALVNNESEKLKKAVFAQSKKIIADNKLPGLVGGDHSTPLGLMEALGEKHGGFGILQIDAHADLRDAYEGFTYSHASIMFNAIKNENVKKLVQVGVRDISDDEMHIIDNSNRRIVTYFNHEIKNALYNGIYWSAICKQIIEELPKLVYISFDIDGLDERYCPNTGTPVPGGLEYEQAVYLLNEIITSGRKIIGFDLVEVAPGKDEWDAIVGARLLYKLCNLTLKSHAQNA